MTQPRFVVHNAWGTYSGDLPGEVLRAVHAETVASGGTMSYREWREWNAGVWGRAAGLALPVGDTVEEEAEFLIGLVRVGALRRGPGPDAPEPEADGAAAAP